MPISTLDQETQTDECKELIVIPIKRTSKSHGY